MSFNSLLQIFEVCPFFLFYFIVIKLNEYSDEKAICDNKNKIKMSENYNYFILFIIRL